jgi:hypothetical protein
VANHRKAANWVILFCNPVIRFQSQLQIWVVACLLSSLLVLGCGKQVGKPKEYAYVSAQEGFLRDQVATVYKKTGKVQNGDRVEVLEK